MPDTSSTIPSSPTPVATGGGLSRWGLFLGPALLVLLLLLPMPRLTPEGHRLAAIMGLVIVYWVTEAIPLAATGFLGAVLCVVLGVAKEKAVFAPFADPVIMQFVGTFMLAAAMEKYGLDRRLALRITRVPFLNRSPAGLFTALAVLTGGLSMWMSNAATTAMMIPIALGALASWPHLKENSEARGLLVLLIAFSASVGGQGTPVGTPPNLVGLGFIRQLLGVEVSFLKWMTLGVPLVVLQLAFLCWFMRPVKFGLGQGPAGERPQAIGEAMGRLSRGEINTLLVFGTAVVLWIVPGVLEIFGGSAGALAKAIKKCFPEPVVGLMAGVLLMVLPISWKTGEKTLPWRDAVRIDWGTIFMFAGGLALGTQLFETGLAKTMGEVVTGFLGQPSLWTLVAVSIILSLAMSEAASNTASANVMVPIMIAVAQAAKVDPVPVAIAACLACSFGFLLPVSTGPNAIAYGTGHVTLRQMMRYGFWLDVVGCISIFLIVRLVFPLWGGN